MNIVFWAKKRTDKNPFTSKYNIFPSIMNSLKLPPDIAISYQCSESPTIDKQTKILVLVGQAAADDYGYHQGYLYSLGGMFIIPTYDVASLYINEGNSRIIIRDIVKIADLYHREPAELCDVTYEVATNLSSKDLLDSLGRDIAIDIETSNQEMESKEIDLFQDTFLCMAVSDGTHTIVWPASLVNTQLLCQIAKGRKCIFHNGVFDTQGLAKFFDVWLNIDHDTMLMSYALDERRGLHSLKHLSKEYLGTGDYEAHVAVFRKGSLHKVPEETLYKYNASDALYTYRLYTLMEPKLFTDNVFGLYNRILLPAANVFKHLQYDGAPVSTETIIELATAWAPKIAGLKAKAQEFATEGGFLNIKKGTRATGGEPVITPINLNSPKQLSVFIYQMLKLPGGPSTNAENLERLRGRHEFIDTLLEYRKYDHMYRSYILGIADDIKKDGRVHSSPLLHGTETGRLSYTKPPVQTIPRTFGLGSDLGRIRSIFAPENPTTHSIVEIDYGKAEIWVAAAISRDPKLFEDLLSGDYHGRTAETCYHITEATVPKDIWKQRRNEAKQITFGIMYGMQAPLLASLINVSRFEAQDFINRWKLRYPQYAQWTAEVERRVLKEGEIQVVSGRKRRFGLVRDSIYDVRKEAMNMPIQGIASDYTLTSLIELYGQLDRQNIHDYCEIMFAIHDSLVLVVKTDYLQEIIPIVYDIMTQPRFPGYPAIDVEVKIGPNWGETKEIDLCKYIPIEQQVPYKYYGIGSKDSSTSILPAILARQGW